MSVKVRETSPRQERARRFPIPMALGYREPGQTLWHQGRVENISRTGVLFTVEALLDESSPIEMTFQLPVEIGGKGAAQVFCSGEIVRTVLPASSDLTPRQAATIRSYQFIPASQPPEAR